MHLFYGGPEFGETYHAAAFVAVSDANTVEVHGNAKPWQSACDFLNAVRANSASLVPNGNQSTAERIGCSADEFLRRRHENLPAIVAKAISPLLANVNVIRETSRPFFSNRPSCFLWTRHVKYKSDRNLTGLAFGQLLAVLQEVGIRPIVIGSATPYVSSTRRNLVDFFATPPFQHNPLLQLTMLNDICDNCPVRFSIGMKSAAMDGLAFARQLTTYYVTHPRTNGRMDKVERAFPAFRKLLVNYNRKFMQFSVRELETVFDALS